MFEILGIGCKATAAISGTDINILILKKYQDRKDYTEAKEEAILESYSVSNEIDREAKVATTSNTTKKKRDK